MRETGTASIAGRELALSRSVVVSAGAPEEAEHRHWAAEIGDGAGVRAPAPSVLRDPLRWKRSQDRFVQIALEVKDWIAATPSAAAARPGRCPCCGAASRPLGGPPRLVGHGVRARQLRGPVQADRDGEIVEVVLRRYRCRGCRAIVAVGPRGLVRRRLFSAGAIGLSLALWAIERLPAGAVRRRVSPWRVVGAAAAATWSSLRRWAGAVRAGRLWPRTVGVPADGMPLREVAARAACRLAALAIGRGRLPVRAFGGAAHAA